MARFFKNEEIVSSLQREIEKRYTIMNELFDAVNELNTKNQFEPQFRRRFETQNVDCHSLFQNKQNAARFTEKHRIPIVETKNLNMSCSSIKSRIFPPFNLQSLKFGVAFARIVYTDYELIEDQIRSSYHSQNQYCFSIDSKADQLFHSKMRLLSSCISNILLIGEELSIDSKGHNVNKAHYNCLKELVKKPGWGYVILLQNHDMITKSIFDLVQIYGILGGANDVFIAPSQNRIDKSLNWNPFDLGLFPNKTNQSLTMSATSVQASFSFSAVEWMTETVDLTKIIDQLNRSEYGVDEILWSVLQASDFLEMPGHFTHKCIDEGKSTVHLSRYSLWSFLGEHCENIRHDICILGVEHLAKIIRLPNIAVNKMLPSFDYASIDCLNEHIFNRTMKQNKNMLDDVPLDVSYYENMVNTNEKMVQLTSQDKIFIGASGLTAIVGIVLIVIGFVLRFGNGFAQFSNYAQADNDFLELKRLDMIFGLFVAAAGVLVLSFAIATISTLKQNRFLLKAYCAIIALMIVVQLVDGLLAFTYSDQVNQLASDDIMYESLSKAAQKTPIGSTQLSSDIEVQFWANTQSSFKCCGVYNSSDWTMLWGKESSDTLSLLNCVTRNYQSGCEQIVRNRISSEASYLGVASMGVLVVEVIASFLAGYRAYTLAHPEFDK
ncbi:unnamed protein product [Caenorhabditis angaria]|uniref:Tetraspanin n=1 Tax=Caenorhabditis angaria TaxID=860376 RepID=A0A9P1IBT2_9PELO|nr:unnamed protein product [Caenorhabditis angaria]